MPPPTPPPGFELVGDVPPPPPGFQMQGASLMQKIQSSAPVRLIQGMRDPIDAGAQMLAHAIPESVTNALDYFPAKLRNSDSPLLQTIGDRFFADPRAKATDQRLTETENQYQASRTATGAKPEDWDVARGTGQVVSPANAALARVVPIPSKATALKLALTGGAAGAIGGLETPVTDPKDQENFAAAKVGQGGTGAAVGAAMTPILGKIVEGVAPKVAALLEQKLRPEQMNARASMMTDEVISAALKEVGQDAGSVNSAYMQEIRKQVLESLKAGKKLDAAALMRKMDFDALKVPATAGAVTRDATQFARERNLRAVPNVGEPLMNTFERQNQRLQEVVGGYGGPKASEPQQAGAMLTKALSGADESMRGKVTAAYTAARNSAGKDMEVPLQGFSQDAANVVDQFGDKVPGAVVSKLKQFGILEGQPGTQSKVFSFEEGEKLLQQINDHVGADRATNTALGKLRTALKGALTQADAGGGVYAPAREAAAARFRLHDAVPALRDVVEGKASPDAFVSRYIVNGESAEVRALAGTLKQTDPTAFAEARNQLGAHLQRAAFGENTAGDKLFSPERFAKALRQVGTEKLSAFFNPQEIEQLQRVSRVGAYINQSPTAAPVLGNPNMAWAGQLLNAIPGVPTAARLGAALKTSVTNASDVNAALAAKVPQQAAEMSPEAARRLRQSLTLGAVGAGSAVAPQ